MRALGTAVALALFAEAGGAWAHHPVAQGPEPGLARSRLAVDVEAAELDLDRRGTWGMVSVVGDIAFLDRLAFGIRMPMAHIRYFDGDTATGIGDLEAGMRAILYTDNVHLFTLSAGLVTELPTGNADNGLGDGHVELSPHIAASVRPDPAVLLALMTSGHFAIEPDDDEHEHEHHGSVLGPHTERELRIRPSCTFSVSALYATVYPELALTLDGGDVMGPLVVGGEVGVIPSHHVRVLTGVEGHVAGPERLDWHAHLGVEYLF